MKDDEWNDVININLNSNYKLTKIVIKDMIKAKWGRIVNISSDAAKIGNPGQSNYSASKAGLAAFSKSIASEVASRGITVNCIAPGFIKTPMTDKLSEDQQNQILKNIPASRFGLPSDVASACIYLSSDEASFVTGSTIHVNGGMGMF
jgi:3-oxoacyl-[acyl-carrier protein] reductase